MTVTAPSPHGTVVTPTATGAPVGRRVRARWRSVGLLATTLLASLTVAIVAGALVVFARDVWFDNLQRPDWVPSTSTFLLLGTIRYVLLALAGWRIWVKAPSSVALTAWLVLLGLSLGWTVLFFGLWVPQWALVEAAALALVGLLTLAATARVSRLAAWLLVPALAWIGFLIAVNGVVVAWN